MFVLANVGANPGLAALWEDERQRRRERGEPVDNIAPPGSQGSMAILANVYSKSAYCDRTPCNQIRHGQQCLHNHFQFCIMVLG